MNEEQRAAVDALLEGQETTKEADCLMGCLWKGLETVKEEARKGLAQAVLVGEIGTVLKWRERILSIDKFDKALDSHPYAKKRNEEIKAESMVSAAALFKKLGLT